MKRSPIRSYIATVGLLGAFLAAEQSCAWQTSMGKAAEMLSKGSTAEAIALLRQVVAEDAGNVDARVLLGTTLALPGSRNESVEQMAEAVRLRPDSATAHHEYAIVLSRFMEVKAARQEFEKALELDPALAEAHVNLSLILAQGGELLPAAEHLDRAIEVQGNTPAAAYTHYLRAKIWGAQDQIEKSIDELQKAAQLRPDYAEAWTHRGGV